MKRSIKRKLKLLAIGFLRDTKKCIFCGSPNVTNEHVFSKRFHKFMDPITAKRAKGIITLVGLKTEQLTFNVPPMRHWQIKCVCGGNASTCNNGWMRELDARMESASSRLMRLPLHQEPFRISEQDQKTIATWAIMKAMVVNHSMVHHTQRRQMMSKIEPPDKWAVWIGHYERGGHWHEEWLCRPFPVLRDDLLATRRSKVAKPNSHASTIVFQNLFVHIVYCRDRRLVTKWRFSGPNLNPISGHIFRIWPALGHSIVWPGKTLTDRDAAIISEAIYEGVLTAAQSAGIALTTAPTIIYN